MLRQEEKAKPGMPGGERQGGWRLKPRSEKSWQETRVIHRVAVGSDTQANKDTKQGTTGPSPISPSSWPSGGIRGEEQSNLGKAKTKARCHQQARVKGGQ